MGFNSISPSYFLAPMAHITHSAFRRLVADFGGYGALFTEMLSGRALRYDNLPGSPYTKRRVQEKRVFYQVLLSGDEDIPAIITRLKSVGPFAIDLNLGCPAPEVTRFQAGAALFRDRERCARMLDTVRAHWRGLLTVKCRLGDNQSGWEEEFVKRLRIFESAGIDAIFLHPRFSDEKLKRTARWERFGWAAGLTGIPIVANGDISLSSLADGRKGLLAPARGIMIGRMAAVMPWIFAVLSGDAPIFDYREVWERFYGYLLEDFSPEKALGRLKEFNAYYARNFFFGHELFAAVQSSASCEAALERARKFFEKPQKISADPSVAGI